MLNTNIKTSTHQTTKVNAVTGIMKKTHPKSVLLNYTTGSKYAERLHAVRPRLYAKWGGSSYEHWADVVVLQTMVIGDNRLMSEVVTLEDYE